MQCASDHRPSGGSPGGDGVAQGDYKTLRSWKRDEIKIACSKKKSLSIGIFPRRCFLHGQWSKIKCDGPDEATDPVA